jgi:plasmid stabilization system protein ParE
LRIRFLPRAVAEYNRAIDYYEYQKSGLGLDFADEIDKSLARIVDFPGAWQPMTKDVRRCLIGRFPYGIMYAAEPGVILVISIFNLNQDPENFSDN